MVMIIYTRKRFNPSNYKTKLTVKSGFLENSPDYPEDQGGDPLPLVAYRNEYGGMTIFRYTPRILAQALKNKVNLPPKDSVFYTPPRPFLKTAMDNNRKVYLKLLQDFSKIKLRYPFRKMKFYMEQLGKTQVNNIRQTIFNFNDPKNSPLTVSLKGFDKPLVDTGFMYNNVNYSVVGK